MRPAAGTLTRWIVREAASEDGAASALLRLGLAGLLRTLAASGEAVPGAAGRPKRLTGTLADITERKRMEEALRRSEGVLQAMLSSAPVILYAADIHRTLTLSEGTGLAALSLTPGEAVGRSVFEFSGGDPALEACIWRALAGETVFYNARFGSLCLPVELKPQRDALTAARRR